MDPGNICIVEELMHCNLAKYIKVNKPLPLADTLCVGYSIASALANLHPMVSGWGGEGRVWARVGQGCREEWEGASRGLGWSRDAEVA